MIYGIIFILYFYATVSLSMSMTDKIASFSKSFFTFGVLNVVASVLGMLFISCNSVLGLTKIQEIFLLIPLSLILCSGMGLLVSHFPDKKEF